MGYFLQVSVVRTTSDAYFVHFERWPDSLRQFFGVLLRQALPYIQIF